MTDHRGARLVRAVRVLLAGLCAAPAFACPFMERLLFADLAYTTRLKTHG